MSEQEDRVSPHTSLMVAAGMSSLNPTSSSGSALTSTPSSAGQTTSGTQRLGALESIAGELYGLSTPIFPPTTFDLPDISFSNSVNSSSFGGGSMFGPDHHGLFGDGTGGQLMGDLTISNHSTQQSQQQQHSSHHQQQLQIQQSLQQIQQQQQLRQQQQGQFPMSACSPHGTSSSDDSDDLPLAQLAKRQAFPSTAAVTTTSSSTVTPEGSGGSQGNSPNNTTTATSTSTSTAVSSGATAKKAKPTKRKKKKDPNEPQKPVSAYALFFRDTQATIKGHNPSASFGEVSKIVASMWDQLDPEHKDVYKKKTETAKKQYLKQLAAYRASQVSQSVPDETEKSPSPSAGVVVSPSQMMSQSPGQQPMGNSSFSAGPVISPPHMVSSLEDQQQMHQHQMQQQQQQQMMQMSPQHQMMQQQQQQMMHQQMQQQQMHQQQQMMTMNNPLPVTPSPPQYQQQQHLSSPPQQHDSSNIYSDFVEPPRQEMDMGYPHCLRVGCTNQAKENPAWDSQYCSNDCVITHCRDIFTTWVSSRSGSNSFPVK